MLRNAKRLAGAVLVYSGAVGLGWVASAALRLPPEFASEEERQERYNELAKSGRYAAKIDREDRLLGLDSLRQKLLADIAPGDRVLEVAAGPATNIRFYPPDVELVMVDCSEEMVAAAVEKQSRSIANVLQMDTENLHAFEDDSFDVVVDTFGLCSYSNPSRALAEMRRVCRPGGRILLLEHGQSSWALLNWYLDRQAPWHSHSWGCIYNRDILALVTGSRLLMLSHERYHFGTTSLIVAVK